MNFRADDGARGIGERHMASDAISLCVTLVLNRRVDGSTPTAEQFGQGGIAGWARIKVESDPKSGVHVTL